MNQNWYTYVSKLSHLYRSIFAFYSARVMTSSSKTHKKISAHSPKTSYQKSGQEAYLNKWEQKNETSLIDYFDQALDDFQDWIVHLKARREAELAEAERIEEQELHQLEAQLLPDDQDTSTHKLWWWSKKSIWTFWMTWWVVVAWGYMLFQSLTYVYLILTGLILSMASEQFIEFFSRWMPRGVAILLSYLLLFLFVLSGIVIVIPFLIQQTAELITMVIDRAIVFKDAVQYQWLSAIVYDSGRLPETIKTSLVQFLETTNLQETIQGTLVENISGIVSMWSDYITNAWQLAVSTLSSVFSWLFQVGIVFIIAIFCSIEKESVVTFLSNVSSHPSRMLHTLNKLYHKLWHWLLGQLWLCLSIWVMVGVWLWVISLFWYPLPNWFTLALIAWLTEFIPYLWPILGWLPGVLVGTLAFWFPWFVVTFIMYGVIQQLENNVMVPLIMSQTLWVSPLLIFICMLICGLLLWLLWVIIAVPIALIVNILYKEYTKNN